MKKFIVLFLCIACFAASHLFAAQHKNTEVLFERASVLMKQGKLNEARQGFQELISLDAVNSGAKYNLACVLAIQGEYEQAIEIFNDIAGEELLDFKAFIFFNIGSIYYKMGIVKKEPLYWKEAHGYFDKAARLVPGWNLVVDMRHFCMTTMGKDNNVLTIDVIGVLPDTAQIDNIFLGEGEKEVLVFDEDRPPVLYFYRSPSCYLLLASGKDEPEFTTMINKALSLLDKEPESKFNKTVRLQALLGKSQSIRSETDLDNSIAILKEAVGLGLNWPIAHTFLGTAYFHKKNYKKAREQVATALSIDSVYERAKILSNLLEKSK